MSEHTCADCRYANELSEAQQLRYHESEKPRNTTKFLSLPYEEEMSALMISLYRRCQLRQQADQKFPTTK